jgi:tetratricopeptide (TPR) repeat protein
MLDKIKLNNIKYEYFLALISLITVIFYTLCSTPSVGFRDGPELVVTATYLDVAHPAGFPTYNLLAKLLTWLPFGSLGFRVTIFSSLCMGLAVFLLGLLIHKIHLFDKNNAPSYIWLLAGLPWFILYQGIWAASVEVEVYSLNVLFIVILFYLATCWYEGKGIIYLYLGGFTYGLACGNHGSLALYLPVLLLLTFWGQPKNTKNGIQHPSHLRIIILAIVFLVAISVYLMLLVRSLTGALPVDFGHTNNLESFWYHITDGKDRSFHVKSIANISNFLFYLNQQVNNMTTSLIWLIIPFMCWGIKYLWDRYQIFSVALILLILINISFFFYWIDGISAFLPSVTAGFLLLFLGLGQFGRRLAIIKIPSGVSLSLAILVAAAGVFFLGQQRFNERETEAGFWATELFWPDLAKVPPESLILVSENWFPELALKNVYLPRPDVSIIPFPALSGSPYVPAVSPIQYPMSVFPRSQSGEYIPATAKDYLSIFLNANLTAGRPVFIQYLNDLEIGAILNLTRIDLNYMWLAELQKDTGAAYKSFQAGDYHKYLEWANQFIVNISKKDAYPSLARKLPVNIYYFIRPVLAYAFMFGEYPLTEKVMSTFIDEFIDNRKSLVPYDINLNAHIFIVNNLMLQNKYEESLEQMEKFVNIDPSIPYSYYILGLIYEKNNKVTEAFNAIEKAIKNDPYDPVYALQYGNLLAKYKQIELGDKFLQERSNFLKSKNMPNSAKILDYYRTCLTVKPEDDTIGSVNILSDIDKYSFEVFR